MQAPLIRFLPPLIGGFLLNIGEKLKKKRTTMGWRVLQSAHADHRGENGTQTVRLKLRSQSPAFDTLRT